MRKNDATVYFVHLTDDDIREINAEGWDSPIGRAYMAAKNGKGVEAGKPLPGLFKKAATVRDVKDAEDVWMRLQNGIGDGKGVLKHLPKLRSMDVGDVVEWPDGRRERVASFGFDSV